MIWLLLAMALMIGFLLGGLWISFSIGTAGLVALFPVMGTRTFSLIAGRSFSSATNFILIAIPLFVFMGEIIGTSGITTRVYRGISKMLSGIPGELLHSNILACTVFSAVSGSSVACAATIGRIAYPELVMRGYNREIAVGSLAAGGTLGILIPPSIIMIVYAAASGASAGQLFIAGVIPGLMMSMLFVLFIGLLVHFRPHLAPSPQQGISGFGFRMRLSGLLEIWPFLFLSSLVLGAIYSGAATATEAAAVGAFGAVLLALGYRELTWQRLRDSCLSTVKVTSMIMLITIAANIMAVSIVYYDIPRQLGQWASSIQDKATILALICVMYIVLGCFFEAFSMILLTLPFLIPILNAVGIDYVWFGILLVILIEIGLLTPPVGVNLFVLEGTTGCSFREVMIGSFPFVIVQVIALVLIIIFPGIALWLPHLMIK